MANNFAELHQTLVEWVYDHTNERSLGEVELSPFGVDHDLDQPGLFALLRYCKDRGLLDDKFSTMGSATANLTTEGSRWVEERRRWREDPRQRAAAARTGLLNWLWKRKHEGASFPIVADILQADESLLEGERLTLGEIDRAAEYLKRKGLIEGIEVNESRGPVKAETTPAGDDCVEHYGGDVSEYERRHELGSTVFNIGSNTGNIAANSRDFKMEATTNGIRAADIVMFARALRQAAPVLGLPEDDARELAETADRMELEASSDQPDTSRLKRWGGAIVGILNSPVVSGALGNILATYGQTVIPGLPPPS
jgi:hypothetical protein